MRILDGRKTDLVASVGVGLALAMFINGWGGAEAATLLGTMSAGLAALRDGLKKLENGGAA